MGIGGSHQGVPRWCGDYFAQPGLCGRGVQRDLANAEGPNPGIAHLSITGGDTTDMKEIFKKKEEADTYIDAQGNEVAIVKKKKASKQDIKKLKKKIAALRKAGEEVWTDEEMEKLGLEM